MGAYILTPPRFTTRNSLTPPLCSHPIVLKQVWPLPMGRLSLMVIFSIAAFSCTPTCFASPNVRRLPLAYPVGARDITNVSFPITQAGLLDPSSTVPGLPDESPTSTCPGYYSPCNLFYQVSH